MVRLVIEGRGEPYRYVVTPNAFHVVTVHDEPARLLPLYRGAWLSLCDSRILRALARLDGGHSLPLVTGSDVVAGALLSALNGIAGSRILHFVRFSNPLLSSARPTPPNRRCAPPIRT